MNIQFYLHLFFFSLIFIIPFLPISWITKGLYLIPSLIILQWIIFDKCILSKGDPFLKNKTFVQRLFELIDIQISEKRASNVTSFLLVLSLTIMFIRLMRLSKKII